MMILIQLSNVRTYHLVHLIPPTRSRLNIVGFDVIGYERAIKRTIYEMIYVVRRAVQENKPAFCSTAIVAQGSLTLNERGLLIHSEAIPLLGKLYLSKCKL